MEVFELPKLRARHLYWLYTLAPALIAIALAVWARDFVALAVSRNAILNLTILGIIVAGVTLAGFGVFSYQREAQALDSFVDDYRATQSLEAAFGRVKPSGARIVEIFRFLARCGGRVDGPMSQTALADEVEHFRENLTATLSLPGFLSGFMIALGLFGTFIGLLETLTSTGKLIAGISGSSDANASVLSLVRGMQGPLLGMGTAFSASLFGLLGSLVLGAMLNALQALSQKIRNDLRAFLDQVVVQGDEAPVGDLTRPLMGLGLTQDFLAEFLIQMTNQQKESIQLFHQTQEVDAAVVGYLAEISQNLKDQTERSDKILTNQETLDRALGHQIETMNMLRATLIEQANASEAMRRSHEDMVTLSGNIALAVDELKRMVTEQGDIQRRVNLTERRSSEMFETLNSGIAALGERDQILRDMQRSAIDAVKHASQIGARINESAISQFQARESASDLLETALVNFAEFKRDQSNALQGLAQTLRDMMRTLERRDVDLNTLLREQSLESTDLRRTITELPTSLRAIEAAVTTDQSSFYAGLLSELRAIRQSLRSSDALGREARL